MYNKRALLEILKNMDSAKAPAKKKDIIVDPMGQWAHPGKVTRIPSNDITMAGVPYPVYGVDNTGFGQMMYPGQNYTFPGDYVDEYPLDQAKKGGIKSKKYSKSLLATNRLFKKNPMFKKKKYKGKTYDPMAMYFQEGGEQACPPGYMWNGLECVINPYDYKPTSRPAFSMTGDGQYRLDPTYDVFAKQRSYVEESNREAQEFNKRYVQSKNFQRLLRKQGYTPEEIDKRIDAVMGINDFRYVDEGPSWVGTNDSGRDFISYNVTDPGDWPGFDQIAAHEWGHVGVDSGSLPLKPKEREEFINRLKEGAAGITGNPDDLLHDMEPQENRADLTQLRQQFQQAGVFDSTKKKKFTKKDLEKYRKIMNSTEENWHNMWNRMFRLYDDEDIIWFMNNIAQKDADQDLNMAEYGGDISIPELTKAQKGGAPTYADSLALYNFNKLQRQLEKPSDLVPSSTQIITLGYSGAITAEGIRKQKILQAEVDRILREHPNIRLGTYAARNQPRYVRNRYGDLVRNFRANSDYEGYVNANGSWDLYHPGIKPKGTWVGLAKNNDYSNVKPKGTPSPAPLPKFEINQVYTFADRPNSYYKMTPEGKMYIKNKDTGNKFVPISDDYAARVKVLREGLASGKTKKYNPPVPPGHEHTGTLNYVDCKNPPPTAGEVQAEVLAAGLGPTAEGARRISKAALDRAEWEKRCAAKNKPVEQTPPKQKVERVELIDAAPEEGEKLQRVDFSKYVKVDYPTEISNKVTFIDEKGRVKTELQYYDVKPDTTPAESVETKTPETQPVRKWDAKANKFVTVEVPYNSVEAKRERAKKEYEARKEYGYRSQTILEPDPKKPGSFKTKEVRSVKYAGPENLNPPRILYYNPETQEYTPDKFRKGGLVNNLPKAQTGSAGKLLKYVTPTVKPVTSFLSTLINPSKVVANLPSTIKSLDTLRNINLEGFGDRFEMANLLKNLNYVGPEFGFNDLYSAAKSDEALNTLMQKAIAYDRTAWRQVNPNISLSGTNPFGEQWSLNKAPFGMERSELENMILHGVDMRDPFSRGEYMATHIPINIYGLREGGLEHLPLSMGALYGSARPEKYDPAYGHFMYRIKQPTDFSTGDWRSWADTYIGNKSPIFMDGTFNYSAMKENPQSVFFDSGYSKGKILNQDDILSVGQGSNTRRWASGRGNKIADVDIDPNNPFPHFYNYMEMSPVERALIEAEQKAIEESWRTGWRGQYKKGGLPKAQAGLTKFSPGRGLGLMDDLGNYVDDIGRGASRLNQFSKINPAVATNTYRDFSVNRPSLGSFSDDFDFMTPEQRRQALKEQMKKWDAENPFSFDMPEDTSAWALDKAIRDEILPEGGLTDVGGFNYLQLDDDIHLGNPWYHYQKEDFSEENWRDIAKRMADEEFMKGLNKKDMLPGSPNHGPINIGDFNYRDFSPGFNYMQKIKSMYAGPQVQLGSQDFFTNQEFKNLMEQRRKYLNAREIFDMDYPEKPYIDENGFTVWGDPNARDELFSLLFPNVGMPNFLSKFTTPTQKVKLQRDGMTLTPGPYLERFALEKYQDAPYDNLQKGAMQLMNDKNGYYTWLEDMDPKMLVKEFGYQLKLKKEDIDNATPEQIEAWRRKIIDGAKQREEERARKSIKSDLENPFKVSHFYQNLPLNKYGGLPEAQLGALIKYAAPIAKSLGKYTGLSKGTTQLNTLADDAFNLSAPYAAKMFNRISKSNPDLLDDFMITGQSGFRVPRDYSDVLHKINNKKRDLGIGVFAPENVNTQQGNPFYFALGPLVHGTSGLLNKYVLPRSINTGTRQTITGHMNDRLSSQYYDQFLDPEKPILLFDNNTTYHLGNQYGVDWNKFSNQFIQQHNQDLLDRNKLTRSSELWNMEKDWARKNNLERIFDDEGKRWRYFTSDNTEMFPPKFELTTPVLENPFLKRNGLQKKGGQHNVGDIVDEQTMEELKRLGYTLEMVK